MKVVIDISRLHKAALKRGVGFYTKNLFDGLKNLNDGNEYVLNSSADKKTKADVVHFPYFDPFFLTLPIVAKKPLVVTIHDLTPLRFPQHFPAGLRGRAKWQIQKQIVKRASAIITDSYNSKRDVTEIIGCHPDKVFVIHLAANSQFRQIESTSILCSIEVKYKLPKKFILYVGDLNWNKNLKALVRAFKKLKTQNSKLKAKIQNLKLIFVGSAFEKKDLREAVELRNLIEKLGLKNDVEYLGFVQEEDLVTVYNLATLYVQPSLYEGFGLPVLEAMACGCAVLSSCKASLPEIGGKAAEYFDPVKKGNLEEKLTSLIGNFNKLKLLKNMGLEQVKNFSWGKTALETKRVYEEISFKV